MKDKRTKEITKPFGMFFTLYGVYLFIAGNITNGLLMMILGELICINL